MTQNRYKGICGQKMQRVYDAAAIDPQRVDRLRDAMLAGEITLEEFEDRIVNHELESVK
ncbi:MAG: hypothetical protein LLF76_00325 [Planctomycetaceae bacterium]|nr:hypothetical protein [Planctomycetaceae bacterium]